MQSNTAVSLFDVIDPATFNTLVQNLIEEQTSFISSGVAQKSENLAKFLSSNVVSKRIPAWAGDSIYDEVPVRCTCAQQWAAAKFDFPATQEDVARRIGTYEARRAQALILSILSGVFMSNQAKDSGDMTFDASGAAFVQGVTNFTFQNLECALDTIACQSELTTLMVHTAVYNRFRKNDLIDFICDSNGNPLPTIQGMKVIFDDGMPKRGNVYDSYLFAPGAVGFAFGNVKHATELEVLPDTTEILYRRWQNCFHPIGFEWTGDTTDQGGPTNAQLSDGASWKRACPDRNDVKMIRLITREA